MDDNRVITNVNSVVGGSSWALSPAGETKNDLDDNGGQLAYQNQGEPSEFVSPVPEGPSRLAGGIGSGDSDSYLAAVVQMQVHGDLQERAIGEDALRQQRAHLYGAASPLHAPVIEQTTTPEQVVASENEPEDHSS